MKTYVSKRDGRTYEYPKWGCVNEEGMLWTGRYENWADKLVDALATTALVAVAIGGMAAAVFALGALFK